MHSWAFVSLAREVSSTQNKLDKAKSKTDELHLAFPKAQVEHSEAKLKVQEIEDTLSELLVKQAQTARVVGYGVDKAVEPELWSALVLARPVDQPDDETMQLVMQLQCVANKIREKSQPRKMQTAPPPTPIHSFNGFEGLTGGDEEDEGRQEGNKADIAAAAASSGGNKWQGPSDDWHKEPPSHRSRSRSALLYLGMRSQRSHSSTPSN